MTEHFAAFERHLCEQFTAAERGPERNALFALWLVLRVASDVLPPHTVSERAHRRRAEALVKRLTSLTLPAPLKQPLHDAVGALASRSPGDLGKILGTLVPVVRETLGKQAAVSIAKAANLAAGP